MTGIRLGNIFELATQKNAPPSTYIAFRLGETSVPIKDVMLKHSFYGGPDHRSPEIEVQISDEFIERVVKERMKDMFCEHVDAMFEPKEATNG